MRLAAPYGEYEILDAARGGGTVILLRDLVVAISTGDRASARTLVGQADFRAEAEAWVNEVAAAAAEVTS